MTSNIFNQINQALSHRLHEALKILLPDGKVIGKYYTCASIKGGHGQSCKTDLSSGRGCDYASGEKWGDIIALVALQHRSSQYEAALFLADMFNIDLNNQYSGSHSEFTGESGWSRKN